MRRGGRPTRRGVPGSERGVCLGVAPGVSRCLRRSSTSNLSASRSKVGRGVEEEGGEGEIGESVERVGDWASSPEWYSEFPSDSDGGGGSDSLLGEGDVGALNLPLSVYRLLS